MSETSQDGWPPAPHEVDDVAEYLFKNYRHLLTPHERDAYETILNGRPSSRPEVNTLLAAGEAEFYLRVRDRVLESSRAEIRFNRCPKCGTLCRTPRACLCPKPGCHHTWFEQREG